MVRPLEPKSGHDVLVGLAGHPLDAPPAANWYPPGPGCSEFGRKQLAGDPRSPRGARRRHQLPPSLSPALVLPGRLGGYLHGLADQLLITMGGRGLRGRLWRVAQLWSSHRWEEHIGSLLFRVRG